MLVNVWVWVGVEQTLVMNACSCYCEALCSHIPVNVCKLSWNVMVGSSQLGQSTN